MSSKVYKFACAPIEDSDKTARMRSLIRVFDRRSMGSQESNVYSDVKLRPWPDCAHAQNDLNLRCRHMPTFCLWWIPRPPHFTINRLLLIRLLLIIIIQALGCFCGGMGICMSLAGKQNKQHVMEMSLYRKQPCFVRADALRQRQKYSVMLRCFLWWMPVLSIVAPVRLEKG